MQARSWVARAAAALFSIGLAAGCGGTHTEFTPGIAQQVRIAQPDLMLTVGATQALTAVAYDNRGIAVPGVTFTWSAFNPAVAKVDQNGLVTAVAPGTTSISAVYNGLIARVGVTVTAGEVVLSFDRDIKTLAALACSCHQPGGSAAQTGSMADLANLLAREYVVAGDPANSPFLISGAGGADHPGGNVLGANQQKVNDWIEQGAQP
ncbi:MAG: hypothetical protein GX774_02010 [Armatimonadetes bacterium]|jgi:hypothetical protein|nr:hypothetical protein [Armatimonadota bacterium]